MVWTLQDAKNRFSEVVEKAWGEGPQKVTKRGKESVIVISAQDWVRLRGAEMSLADFFRCSPLIETELDISRDSTPIRSVVL